MKKLALGLSFLIAAAGSANAYTSYLKPADFWPDASRVTVQGSYTTTFFTPQIALAAEFALIEPNGQGGVFSQAEITGEAAILSANLPRGGTYKLTTGEVLGQVTTLVGVGGQWRPLGQGETPQEGAPVTTLQTISVADVYVTRGGPTRDTVDATAGRLALRPITHPNQVLVSQGFQVQAMFDGAPFANTALVLYREGDAETDLDTYFATDANGVATIALDQPGNYVLAARHRANAAAGSAAEVQSFTTTLVFEALNELPAITEVTVETEPEADPAQRPRERPRRRYERPGSN